MARELPYFKWYPADAMSDSDWAAMDHAERGFYMQCLNFAWINGGIPADPDERARLLCTRRSYADKLWIRVGRKFVISNETSSLLVNPRAQTERQSALAKSQVASESAKVGSERRANASRHARARAESESVYESVLDSKKEIPIEADLVITPKQIFQMETRGKLIGEMESIPEKTSARGFDEFYARWVELTKRRIRRSQTLSAWLSVVSPDAVQATMACLERYGLSRDVSNGAVMNPDGWLFENAPDGWQAAWPTASQSNLNGRSQKLVDYLNE